MSEIDGADHHRHDCSVRDRMELHERRTDHLRRRARADDPAEPAREEERALERAGVGHRHRRRGGDARRRRLGHRHHRHAATRSAPASTSAARARARRRCRRRSSSWTTSAGSGASRSCCARSATSRSSAASTASRPAPASRWRWPCDMRIGAQRLRLIAGYPRIGGSPDGGLTWTLPQAIGYEQAMRFLLENRTVDADEALRLGFVGEIVPDDAVRRAAGGVLRVPRRALADREPPDEARHRARDAHRPRGRRCASSWRTSAARSRRRTRARRARRSSRSVRRCSKGTDSAAPARRTYRYI